LKTLRLVLTLMFLAACGVCAAQSQPVTTAQAQQAVLYYLQDPISTSTTAQKIARIGLTASADITTLEQVLAEFTTNYGNCQIGPSCTAGQTAITELQQNLTPLGYSQLSGFISAEQKSNMNADVNDPTNVSYQTVTPVNLGYPGSGSEQYGYDTFKPSNCGGPGPVPTIAYDGTTVFGETKGTTQSVSMFIPNAATVLPTDAGEPGAGQQFTVVFHYTFVIYILCKATFVPVTFTMHEEIAFAKSKRTGPGYDCSQQGNFYICYFPTAPLCTMPAGNNPDLNPTNIDDSYSYAAWREVGILWRYANSGPWGGFLNLAVGTNDTGLSPACTYNP
jgi:hypothetical protein